MTERELFAAALEVPDPHRRAVYVQSACGGDPMLLKNVETLLRSHDETGGTPSHPPVPRCLPGGICENIARREGRGVLCDLTPASPPPRGPHHV
jgi:hypothetical protein